MQNFRHYAAFVVAAFPTVVLLLASANQNLIDPTFVAVMALLQIGLIGFLIYRYTNPGAEAVTKAQIVQSIIIPLPSVALLAAALDAWALNAGGVFQFALVQLAVLGLLCGWYAYQTLSSLPGTKRTVGKVASVPPVVGIGVIMIGGIAGIVLAGGAIPADDGVETGLDDVDIGGDDTEADATIVDLTLENVESDIADYEVELSLDGELEAGTLEVRVPGYEDDVFYGSTEVSSLDGGEGTVEVTLPSDANLQELAIEVVDATDESSQFYEDTLGAEVSGQINNVDIHIEDRQFGSPSLDYLAFEIENTGELPISLEDTTVNVNGEEEPLYVREDVAPGETLHVSTDDHPFYSGEWTEDTNDVEIVIEDHGQEITTYSVTASAE